MRLHLLLIAALTLLSLGGCEGVLGPLLNEDTTSDTSSGSDMTSASDTGQSAPDTAISDTGSGNQTGVDTTGVDQNEDMSAEPTLPELFDVRYQRCQDGCYQAFGCNDLWDSVESCQSTCDTIRGIDDESVTEDWYVDPIACINARLAHQECVQSITDCDTYNEATYGNPGNLCEFEDSYVSDTACVRN